ncbi:MAG: LOG family protein, partial [Candidatus Pacebacteria bacterium]|nr:LOG family protein [Candidatus Paceibacterota bacterium]
TGGGGGIMEAGNRGSKEACNCSVGFNIELPFEQTLNPHVTHGIDFQFFASRKMSMYFSGEAFIFFAGGYGTLDEFFQILTLMQTSKSPVVPIICVGSSYWNGVDHLIKEILLKNEKTISPEDLDLYTITDDAEEVLNIIRTSPKESKE